MAYCTLGSTASGGRVTGHLIVGAQHLGCVKKLLIFLYSCYLGRGEIEMLISSLL